MKKNITVNSQEDQARRLQIKTINQQMKNLAVQGTGISPWEAQVLVDIIEEGDCQVNCVNERSYLISS